MVLNKRVSSYVIFMAVFSADIAAIPKDHPSLSLFPSVSLTHTHQHAKNRLNKITL